MLVKVVRDETIGTARDGQLDDLPGVVGTGRGEAADVAHTVDHDTQLYELTCVKALELVCCAQRQRHRPGGTALHADNAGASLFPGDHRVDQLEVAVNGVRGQGGCQQPAQRRVGGEDAPGGFS
ncbi:Uncharacterised protein [Mycobacteroides abscessus subsp. abscessus]|nr:Uncharacterised protein [Mycobacteroides abscessus subsp. abscessus]